ncbi:MAG: DUF5018 domain-containing protein [Tidjanibacter sp.]|nr:DUF5018 domain-containing protein [Tidjanibacter sp.]
MKKISIFATALLLAWGCVNDFDENIAPEGSAKGAFNVIASADNDHRTAYSEVDGVLTASWKAADEIDIISMVDGGEAPYEKLTYTADAAGTKVAFSPKTDALTLKEGGQNYKFYAYYHYFKNEADTKFTYENGIPYLTCHMNGKTNNWSIQGAVDNDGTKRLYQFDLLWANPVAVANPSGNVDLNFQFNHAFAVLEFKLTTTGSEDIKLKQIQVDAAGITDNAVKVNLADGSLTNSKLQNTCKMNFNVVPTLKAGGANSYSCYMTILPGHAGKKFTITVTDQNSKTYTFEKTPSKAIAAGQRAVLPLDVNPKPEAPTVNRVEKGVASTTPTKVWSVNLTTLEGVNAANITGIALSNGKLLLSENGNSSPVYLNALTGAKEGTMDVSAVTAANTNYYATSDDAGNILFCNYWDNVETATFTIFKSANVTATPESFVTQALTLGTAGKQRVGYKISVQGDVTANAMISTCVGYTGALAMYVRPWQVKNGAVSKLSDLNVGNAFDWNQVKGTRCDAVYATSSASSDLYYTCYAKWSGDNTRYFKNYKYASYYKYEEKSKVTDEAIGFVSPATDVITFNNASYAFVMYVNNATQLNYDVVRMYDVTEGILDTSKRTNVAGNHVDGSWYVNKLANSNMYGDVLAHVDGDYMYVYVMFANGNVSCYKYTCLAE